MDIINLYFQVPLGVIPKDENKLKEMVQILGHLHQYVPQLEFEEQTFVSETDEKLTVCKAATHNIMLGGDQLSKVRATSAIKIKANAEKPSKRLEGFIPTVEDWYAKLTLMEVSLLFYSVNVYCMYLMCRLFGNTISLLSQRLNMELVIRYEIFLVALMLLLNQKGT